MGVFQKETKPETEGWNTPQTQRDWYTGLRLPDALALVPALVAFGGQRMLAGYPSFTETWFSARLFRWIADPIAWISSMVPFSLTEFLVWSALPLIIVLGTRVHRRAQVHGKPVWVRAGVHGVWIVSIAYLVFMLLFGFHYGRLPMAERYGLQVKERPVEELAGMTLMLAETASEFRRFVQEDEEGVMVLRKGSTGALRSGYVGFQYASAAYPELKMPRRRAKSVLSSGLWSYTGISGMYFPFFVEANVNTDMPYSAIASTTLHELAHTLGFAREDEAEFIGFLAGIHHPDPDFKYSAKLNAFIHASNALYRADSDTWQEVTASLSEGVRRDINARRRYWQEYQGPVERVSTRINDAYLKSNMQRDGVRSYGAVVDLLLAHYAADRLNTPSTPPSGR